MTTTTLPHVMIAPVREVRPRAVASPAAPIEVRQTDVVRARDQSVGIDDDPFHDPLLGWIGLVMAIVIVLNLALGGLFYWGVQYQSPSWNANSFPSPVVH